MNHTAVETPFVDQLQLHADTIGDGLAAASHHHGRKEQVVLGSRLLTNV